MMSMGGEGSIIDRLRQLHLVPLAISYEYDPCDYLKAKEYQQKRDNADWKKGPTDDLVSMQTGIFGYKGHVHYHAAACVDEFLDTLDPEMPKQDIYNKVVAYIDLVYAYLDKAGLGDRGLSVHKLRHTAATLMYQNGHVDLLLLKEILGHENLGTTEIYTHISDDAAKAAIEANPLADLDGLKSRSQN